MQMENNPRYEHYVLGEWHTDQFQVIYPVALPEEFVKEQTKSMIRLALLPIFISIFQYQTRFEQWRLRHAM